MRNPERLRAVQRTLRETHRKLHDLQGESIASLRGTVDAERLTIAANQDALAALETTAKTLEIVSEAHDAMTVLYESDDDLEEIATDSNSDTP